MSQPPCSTCHSPTHPRGLERKRGSPLPHPAPPTPPASTNQRQPPPPPRQASCRRPQHSHPSRPSRVQEVAAELQGTVNGGDAILLGHWCGRAVEGRHALRRGGMTQQVCEGGPRDNMRGGGGGGGVPQGPGAGGGRVPQRQVEGRWRELGWLLHGSLAACVPLQLEHDGYGCVRRFECAAIEHGLVTGTFRP